MPEFILGMLMYSLYRSGRLHRWMTTDAAAIGLLAALLVLLQIGMSDFLTVLVFALFVLAAVSNEARVTQFLNAAALLWLGELSYSLCLAHGLVQFGATRLLSAEGISDRGGLSQLSSMLLIGAMFLIACGIAALIYLTVERIARRRLRRLFGLAKPKMAAG